MYSAENTTEVECVKDSIQADLQVLTDSLTSLDGMIAELGRRTAPIRLSFPPSVTTDSNTKNPERERSPIAKQIAAQNRTVQGFLGYLETIICEFTI